MAKLSYPPVNPNVDAEIIIEGEMTENGAFSMATYLLSSVYYLDRIRTLNLSDGSKVTSVGKLIISHDIAPGLPLRGSVKVKRSLNVLTLKIAQGSRFFNPDGSVHHVELELM